MFHFIKNYMYKKEIEDRELNRIMRSISDEFRRKNSDDKITMLNFIEDLETIDSGVNMSFTSDELKFTIILDRENRRFITYKSKLKGEYGKPEIDNFFYRINNHDNKIYINKPNSEANEFFTDMLNNIISEMRENEL